VTERFNTLGELDEDQSANARQSTQLELLPQIAVRPFGFGLGSAGEPSRLRAETPLRAPDNGYLSVAYQLGPVGGLVFIGAFIWAATTGARGARRAGPHRRRRATLAAIFAFFAVALYLGEAFYGLAGVLLWYFVGVGLHPDPEPTTVRAA
jgi:O-antigen ligase